MESRLVFTVCVILRLSIGQPTFTVERNGSTYTLNAGLCEPFSCGSDERRGACVSEIYRGRPAHFCRCNLPFTGAFCDETLRLNATLPGSVYVECVFPLYCASVYGNGECNQECNNAACLYDGYECTRAAACPREEYCRERFANGVCDDECAREECEFDGGDCFGVLDALPGQLLIRLSMSAQDFLRLSHLFLFQLSRFLRATVVLSQDAAGPLIWAWSAADGRGGRIGRDENSTSGIEAAFSVDLTRCSSECLDSIARVVDFINQALSSKSLPLSSALSSVISVSSSPAATVSTFARRELAVISIAVTLLLVVALAGTIQLRARKRTIIAPIWLPPTIGGTADAVPPKAKRARHAIVASELHKQAAGTDRLYALTLNDVNGRDAYGRTPLLLVVASARAESQAREAIDQLLAAGANVRAVDDDGWGVLHHALHKLRSPNFVRSLIGQGADLCAVDVRGRNVVHLATEYDDLPNLRVVLEAGAKLLVDEADDNNRVPIAMAVSDCSLAVARCLVEFGASIDNFGYSECDPTKLQKHPLHYAVEANNKEHTQFLLNRGCLLEVRDSRERSALHYAVIYADLTMCRILVDSGVPVDLIDDEERTAEDLAADWNMIEVRDYLRSVRGANEVYPRRKRGVRRHPPKRYSSDQGYGSEESSQRSTPDLLKTPPMPRLDVQTPPPLLLQHQNHHQHPQQQQQLAAASSLYISPRASFGIPKWGANAQLPMFNTKQLTPLASLAATPHHTALNAHYPKVLTPSTQLLHRPESPPPFASNYLTPL